MKDRPLTIQDLAYFRAMREWLGITNTHAVYSVISGKKVGYIKLGRLK